MNKIVSDISQIVKEGEEQNYAVIITDGKNKHGLFNVSTAKEAEETLKKVAVNDDNLPLEIINMAMGVINTLYMSKTGSEWPLFNNVQALEDNVLANSDIDWTDCELSQKNAERQGVVYNGTFLPLDTKANIKAAADLLAEWKDSFSGTDRIKFASAIVDQADKLNAEINETVLKYAFGTLNPEFYNLMDERIKIAEGYDDTQKLLISIKNDAPAMDVEKVADALEVTDHMLPFSMKFATQVRIGSARPIFSSSIDTPDAFNTVYGVQIRPETFIEKVSGISDEKLSTRFTKVFINKLRDDTEGVINRATPTVVATLRNLAS